MDLGKRLELEDLEDLNFLSPLRTVVKLSFSTMPLTESSVVTGKKISTHTRPIKPIVS